MDRVIKAILLSVVVSAICLIPPGIHFVTGLLAPLISGYVSGTRYKLSFGESTLLGFVLAIIAGGGLIMAFLYVDYFPDLTTVTAVFFGVVAALYIGVLTAIAAGVAGGQSKSS